MFTLVSINALVTLHATQEMQPPTLKMADPPKSTTHDPGTGAKVARQPRTCRQHRKASCDRTLPPRGMRSGSQPEPPNAKTAPTVRSENKGTLRAAGKTNKHAFPSEQAYTHTRRAGRRPRQTPWAHNDGAHGTAQALSKRKMGDAHKHDRSATQEARATAEQQ